MSDDIVQRAEAALEGVTPGPWTWDGDSFSDVEHQCPHGTQWCDHGPDLVRGNPDGSPIEEFDVANMVITSNGYDASGLEVRTADAEFIIAARDLIPELVAEIRNLRTEAAFAKDGMQIRPMTEVESNLMTQVLDLRRELAAARLANGDDQ